MKTTYSKHDSNLNDLTVIEYRDHSGRLRDAVFDEPEFFVQIKIDEFKEFGLTDIKVVNNPHNFHLFI